jgi:hypothetical protein
LFNNEEQLFTVATKSIHCVLFGTNSLSKYNEQNNKTLEEEKTQICNKTTKMGEEEINVRRKEILKG